MRRTRRHKYLQISVFFLLYSIIHVVSVSNKDDSKQDANAKTEGQNVDINKGVPTADATSHHPGDTEGKNMKNSETYKHLAEKVFGNMGHSFAKTDTKNDRSEGPTSEIHPFVAGKSVSNVKHALGENITDNDNSTKHELQKFITDKIGTHVTHVMKQNSTDTKTDTTRELNNTAHSYILNRIEHMIRHIFDEPCTPPAIQQFPHPIMSPSARRHGGLIIHIIVAAYMFLGLAIVCDEYFVASLDRICEELKMSPDVAGATFMAAGSSAPELATVIIGVFLAQDDIGISGVIGSAVFNIMFVISCCGLCSSAVIYLNWWPLVRDCFFYAVSILVMLAVIYDTKISWVESLLMLLTYLIYCVVLHFNTSLERYAQTLPVPFKHRAPTEESGLVSYKTLDDDGKPPNYGMEWSPEKQHENGDQAGMNNFGADWSPEKHQQGFANQLSGPALNQATIDPSPPPPTAPAAPPKPSQQDYYKPKEYDPSTQVNPLTKPEAGGWYAQTSWAVVYPIHWLCRMTMPDCRSDKYKNWYPFTFFISMVWISFYSYFMVWMITIIGFTLDIPDTVMGLTFVAAGVSVPDALSSIAVIKEGYGDMAVSNAVGSNVFDILICLGLPWFIKTAIVNPGSTVIVLSKGLAYSTLSLLSTVVFLVVATHLNGWKLDRRYGVILMIWYLIFITFASLYELNVFGKMNPRQCDSDW